MKNLENDAREEYVQLLLESGQLARRDVYAFTRTAEVHPLFADGSCRRFFRIVWKGKRLCLAAAPAVAAGKDLAEARAAALIGSHLRRKGIPVPAVLAWRAESGLILFEDLGDVRLHDLASEEPWERLRTWYRLVVDGLVAMQLAGAEGFDTAWCWDTPRYDRELMILRESRYFLQSFWCDLLGFVIPDGIEEEFAAIAAAADGEGPDVFLHRDFQSRNIMIKDGAVRFIDFQGGRLGPPGYDPASLLLDPYMGLCAQSQEEVLDYYLSVLAELRPALARTFRMRYPFLALQRNLQILGAFSFLSRVRKKEFFAQYIAPSLQLLRDRLAQPELAGFPVLRRMVTVAGAAFR